jgi:hypothetical protein
MGKVTATDVGCSPWELLAAVEAEREVERFDKVR